MGIDAAVGSRATARIRSMSRWSATSALIRAIFSRSAGMGLHEQVVDLRRDDVRVLRDDRREDVGLADRGEDRRPRPVAAGQHEPDRGALVAGHGRGVRSFVAAAAIAAIRAASAAFAVRSRSREVGGRQRQDHVLAVARHDDERARPDALEHVAGLHRPDRDAVDHPVEVGSRVDRLAVDALEDHRERRVREDRPDRQHAEERDAVAARGRVRGPRRSPAARRGRPC